MTFIYILALEDNKYYIGKTTNPNFNLTHFNINNLQWTNKYKPIKIINFIANCDNFDEDKYTLKYMSKYGVNNTRGGSFSQLILNEKKLEIIMLMINNSTNKNITYDDEDITYDDEDITCNNKYITCNDEDLVDDCECIHSFFSQHKKNKCILNNTVDFAINIFDDDKNIIDKIKKFYETQLIINNENQTLQYKKNICNKLNK